MGMPTTALHIDPAKMKQACAAGATDEERHAILVEAWRNPHANPATSVATEPSPANPRCPADDEDQDALRAAWLVAAEAALGLDGPTHFDTPSPVPEGYIPPVETLHAALAGWDYGDSVASLPPDQRTLERVARAIVEQPEGGLSRGLLRKAAAAIRAMAEPQRTTKRIVSYRGHGVLVDAVIVGTHDRLPLSGGVLEVRFSDGEMGNVEFDCSRLRDWGVIMGDHILIYRTT